MAGIFSSLFGSATGGGGGGGGGDVSSVNGMKGAVVITGENTRATVNNENATVTMHLTTIKNNQGDLGDQVSGVESKIPADASETNQLVTKNGVAGAISESVTTKDLTVGTDEGTLNIGITAGTATIATNNGLDIVAQTKFDTAPTTDDATAWADVNATALVTKAQVTTALSTAGGGTSVTIRNWA